MNLFACIALLGALHVYVAHGTTAERHLQDANRVVKNPEEFVDIKTGTSNLFDYSEGNTIPLVGRPWGFNYWTPQNIHPTTFIYPESAETYFNNIFTPKYHSFHGIRCTHQPSPWIGEYGSFIVVLYENDGNGQAYHGFAPGRATWKPYLFETELVGGGMGTAEGLVKMAVSATSHAAMIRFQWPRGKTTNIKTFPHEVRVWADRGCKRCGNQLGEMKSIEKDGKVVGLQFTSRRNSGAAYNKDLTMYTHMEFSVPTEKFGMLNAVPENETSYNDWLGRLYFPYVKNSAHEVVLRIATSFISYEQAKLNLKEIEGVSFDQLVEKSKKAWNDQLSVFDVVDSGMKTEELNQEKLNIFYTNLYRASLFPRSLAEIDKTGKMVHYSPYDPKGGVHDGELSTDSGFWDAYHTVYPFLGLVYPKRLRSSLAGWYSAYLEGGWIPQWASPGYKNSMVGTMSDLSISDAIVKEIVAGDFAKQLYVASRKNAYVEPPEDENVDAIAGKAAGRKGLRDYIQYGYIGHHTVGESVSRTLNYMFADWALGQAAKKLKETKDATELNHRGMNYKVIFNPTTKFFWAKDAKTGKFIEPFDEFQWDEHFTEGGPWQFRFYAPQDVHGIAAMYGGEKEFCDEINKAIKMPPTIHGGRFDFTIHEMSEMVENGFGQYQHNNQPMHATLYMPIAAGGDKHALKAHCIDPFTSWIKQVMNRLYTEEGYGGDEDNGEMASWFLLSSMGLYDMAPGSPGYVVGVPYFRHLRLYLDGGKTLDFMAPNNCLNCTVVNGVTFAGKAVKNRNVNHQDLIKGGRMVFDMVYNGDEEEEEEDKDSAASSLTGLGCVLVLYGLFLVM